MTLLLVFWAFCYCFLLFWLLAAFTLDLPTFSFWMRLDLGFNCKDKTQRVRISKGQTWLIKDYTYPERLFFLLLMLLIVGTIAATASLLLRHSTIVVVVLLVRLLRYLHLSHLLLLLLGGCSCLLLRGPFHSGLDRPGSIIWVVHLVYTPAVAQQNSLLDRCGAAIRESLLFGLAHFIVDTSSASG